MPPGLLGVVLPEEGRVADGATGFGAEGAGSRCRRSTTALLEDLKAGHLAASMPQTFAALSETDHRYLAELCAGLPTRPNIANADEMLEEAESSSAESGTRPTPKPVRAGTGHRG